MREIKFRAYDGEKMYDPMPIIDFKVMEINGIALMQYTGLKDKNGVEIYEGDVVMYHDPGGWYGPKRDCNHTVEYVDGRFEPFYDAGVDGATYTYPRECEVIGNIYENPGLVK